MTLNLTTFDLFPKKFVLYNKSTRVTDADLSSMISALNAQMVIFSKDWMLPFSPSFEKGNNSVTAESLPSNNWVMNLVDTPPPSANVGGYHTVSDTGKVIGNVFVKTILDAGGKTLFQQPFRVTVSSVLSHEILECLCNPFVNKWQDNWQGKSYVVEVCDPVNTISQVFTTGSPNKDSSVGRVCMAAYVTPNWFKPDSPPGSKFDSNGLITQPFKVYTGGYIYTSRQGSLVVSKASQVASSLKKPENKSFISYSMDKIKEVGWSIFYGLLEPTIQMEGQHPELECSQCYTTSEKIKRLNWNLCGASY